MFQPDLSPHPTSRPDNEIVFVGHISPEHPFSTGVVSPQFLELLAYYCKDPHMSVFCSTECALCKQYEANAGAILVRGANRLYLAPILIHHYVAVHSYLPPEEFILTILATPFVDGKPQLLVPPPQKPHPWVGLSPRQIVSEYKVAGITQDPRWHDEVADMEYFELREGGEFGYTLAADMDALLRDPQYNRGE